MTGAERLVICLVNIHLQSAAGPVIQQVEVQQVVLLAWRGLISAASEISRRW